MVGTDWSGLFSRADTMVERIKKMSVKYRYGLPLALSRPCALFFPPVTPGISAGMDVCYSHAVAFWRERSSRRSRNTSLPWGFGISRPMLRAVESQRSIAVLISRNACSSFFPYAKATG